MGLQSKYDDLIHELQRVQAQIAHVSKAFYHEHQRVIDAAGTNVIAFERAHKIDEARALVEHEKGFAGHLEQFESMVRDYSQPVDWARLVASGEISAEQAEAKMAERPLILAEAQRSVQTLTRMTKDAEQRRKAFSREVLEVARRPDPLNRNERETFTILFLQTRAARATQELITA